AGETILTSVGVVIKGRGATTMFKTTIALINLLSSDNSNHFNNPLHQFHHSKNHHRQHHPVLLKLYSRNLRNPLQVLFRTPTASRMRRDQLSRIKSPLLETWKTKWVSLQRILAS
ncbi:hypothetical protein PIB30_104440, partial [Stylosanthes scabra]|nr:hypothetical protein [Stylosanthes scabra]